MFLSRELVFADLVENVLGARGGGGFAAWLDGYRLSSADDWRAARDALRARDADAAARGRAELEAFYDAHAPDKRANVGALLAQAGGDLEGLVRQVYAKCAAACSDL